MRWIRGHGQVERDDEGTVTRLHGTVQDITDQREAGALVGEATERLELLQKFADAANRSSTLADALVRSAKVVTDLGRWSPLCVFTRAERGAPLTALELPEPVPSGLHHDVAIAEEAWESRDVLITPIGGPESDRSLVTLPVRSGRGLACVIQLVADVAQPDVATWSMMRQVSDQLSLVAERERISLQLGEARDEAMAASRHKSDFLATMSHEIRTPMNGVIGLTDLLLATELDGQQRRLAEGLRGAGLTLLALINDILDLSKIESGKLELEVTEFDLRAVVDETTLILAGRAQDKGLELVVDVAPDVPRVLLGDPVRLGQVITNLGSNAVKFTERGEVVIEVGLEAPITPDEPDARAAGRGARHRHRDRRGGPREALRRLHPGRPLDDAAARRHRPGPDHLPAARGEHGRLDRRPQPSRAPAARSGSRCASVPRPRGATPRCSRRSRCAGAGCSWSTTTPPRAPTSSGSSRCGTSRPRSPRRPRRR